MCCLIQIQGECHKKRKAGNKDQLVPVRIHSGFMCLTNDLLDRGSGENGGGERKQRQFEEFRATAHEPVVKRSAQKHRQNKGCSQQQTLAPCRDHLFKVSKRGKAFG